MSRRAALLTALLAIGLPGCGEDRDAGEQVLHVYESSAIKGLDPIYSSTVVSARQIMNVYDGLMEFSYLERPFQVVPALAAGPPEVSSDGLGYTFRLRKGVRFHDDPCFPGGKGRELTAADVVFSWKRLADVRNQSEGWWILDDKVVGLNAFRKYTQELPKEKSVDYSRAVEGLKVVDTHTLEVRLTRAYPQLLQVLALSYARVVPREAVRHYGKEFLNHPVGTGPFHLKKWVRGSRLEYERNPHFRKETYPSTGGPGDREAGLLADAGKPVPFLDRVVVHIVVEDQPRWLQFMRGGIDMIAPPKDNYQDALPRGELSPDMKKRGVRSVEVQSLDVAYLAVNMDDPVLGHPAGEKGKRLRRALSLAIDRQKNIELFWAGRGRVAHGPVPPGLDGHDESFENPWVRHDPEQAKALLAEAGYPEGKGLSPIRFEGLSGASSRQRGEFLKRSLAKVGITLEVAMNSWPELNQKIKTRRAQMWAMSWVADYPDAQTFLTAFYSPNASPGLNGTNHSHPDYDADYERSALLPPGEERAALYRKMARHVADELPWIPLVHSTIDTLVHPWLKNFKPHEPGMEAFWKYLRVDPAEKARRR